MSTNNINGHNKFHRGKVHQLEAELNIVHKAFKEKPMTMMEVDAYIGILPDNICRYVAMLLVQGRIAVMKERKCKITGFQNINVYTGNPNLFPKSN